MWNRRLSGPMLPNGKDKYCGRRLPESVFKGSNCNLKPMLVFVWGVMSGKKAEDALLGTRLGWRTGERVCRSGCLGHHINICEAAGAIRLRGRRRDKRDWYGGKRESWSSSGRFVA